ncbi:Uncharacterized protein Adt_47779 [Abeliophyllum distichum]|uniref:Retrotransposon gag domain-containing protein n=1 Tax=Abeliophyllum distichum TaxID=126358 RepID=A0ABD1NUT8_9LAMI
MDLNASHTTEVVDHKSVLNSTWIRSMGKRLVGNGQAAAQEHAPRLRIPELCTYGGTRDAKEVENFLFDMEQYFLAANIEDGTRRVTIATMYLGGDAKLWWRTNADIQANRT